MKFYLRITMFQKVFEHEFMIDLSEQNQSGFSTKFFKSLAWFELNLCVSLCVHEYIGYHTEKAHVFQGRLEKHLGPFLLVICHIKNRGCPSKIPSQADYS